MYQYGFIGNCQTSALVSGSGSIDWLCFPRPDSPPIFGRLLDDGGGFFDIEPHGDFASEQHYVPNTAILVTTLTAADGSRCRITDFCPRFYVGSKIHRPNALFRMIEPLDGTMALKIRCHPVSGWSKKPAPPLEGAGRLRYEFSDGRVEVVTNMPLALLKEEAEFRLKEPLFFSIQWGAGLEADAATVIRREYELTMEYWKTWVSHCSIPSTCQEETIRSAITLKLHCYEDTGAILASPTTSLPEEAGTGRNWDYRYCWLRDAHFVLSAFQRLGHFEETEGFLKFLLGIAEKTSESDERLRPVYALDLSDPLPETIHADWAGFAGHGPVRSKNKAAEQTQHDVYGEMILTLTPIYFDERFRHLRTPEHERLLGKLAKMAKRTIGVPDAGLWELREGWREHSFSNLMSWAGLERVRRIQRLGYLQNLDFNVEKAIQSAKDSLKSAMIGGALRNGPMDDTVDAGLLQVAMVGFPDVEIVESTVRLIQDQLRLGDDPFQGSFLFRYRRRDDFGCPASAFLICSFWLVQALAKINDLEQARTVMKNAMTAANSLGLYSEHFVPSDRRQLGNFPQAYSHVGLINAAFAISPPWDDVL